LLKIPDDFDGLQNNSNSNIMQKQQLQKRSSSAKISIQSLERVVELDNHILTNISVDIQAGQVVGIIGPSGSGKSTLLRAINRLWEPPGDSIFLDGEDITKLNVLSVRRRIGMLFQTPLLFDGKFMASMCRRRRFMASHVLCRSLSWASSSLHVGAFWQVPMCLFAL
jgi:ABC-type bacteriocin/lantibiotic exporter with double-glycine peptidase domain